MTITQRRMTVQSAKMQISSTGRIDYVLVELRDDRGKLFAPIVPDTPLYERAISALIDRSDIWLFDLLDHPNMEVLAKLIGPRSVTVLVKATWYKGKLCHGIVDWKESSPRSGYENCPKNRCSRLRRKSSATE